MMKLFSMMTVLSTSSLLAIDLEIDMGTGLFYTAAQGRIEYVDEGFKGSYSEIDLKNSGQFYLWGDFKSTIGYLPKLRLQYLRVNTGGDSKLHLESADIPPEYQNFIDLFNDSAWESSLSHNVYDVYLYYEFFEEEPYPSVGIGGGIKSFDYAYNVELIMPLQVGDRGDKSIPMLFLTSRYELPSVQMGFEFESEVYIFGDSNLYDIRAKMDLLLDIDESTRGGFEIGYRESYYDLRGSDVDSFTADMHYKGLYAGVVASFK